MKKLLLIVLASILATGASYGMGAQKGSFGKRTQARGTRLSAQDALKRRAARWGVVVTALNKAGVPKTDPAIFGWAAANQKRAQTRLTRLQKGQYVGGRRAAAVGRPAAKTAAVRRAAGARALFGRPARARALARNGRKPMVKTQQAASRRPGRVSTSRRTGRRVTPKSTVATRSSVTSRSLVK